MGLFGNNKKDSGEASSSPVVSEKTKTSASFLKKTTSKIGGIFRKNSVEDLTVEPMSNAGYLGEIYKLMVQNRDDLKFERQQQVNRKEEEDSEDQKRHSEIIRALTI
jgi:tRNA splicing endonuclease